MSLSTVLSEISVAAVIDGLKVGFQSATSLKALMSPLGTNTRYVAQNVFEPGWGMGNSTDGAS